MVAVTSGDLIPLLDDNGSGVYNKGRNNSRDIRVGLLGSMFLSGSDGYTPRPGVLVRSASGNDLKVDQAVSPNQTVIVRKGDAVIPRTGQGAYLFVNEADQIVNMPAASAVNPRYDLVCASAFDKGNFVGDAAHGPEFVVVQGVVGGAPAVPATPAGMLKLAEVLRAVNDNTISTEIADKRTSTSLHNPARILLPGDSSADAGIAVGEIRYSTLAGPEIWTGALWIPMGRPAYANIAAIPAALAVSGSIVYHTGLKRMIRHNGTSWDNTDASVRTVRYTDSGGSQSFVDGNSTIVQFRTATTTNTGVVVVSGTNNDTFTVQQTGEYQLSAGLSLASGAVIEFSVQVNGTNVVVNTTSLGTVSASTTRRLTAGDVVKANCFQASGGARLIKTGFGETTHIAIKLLDVAP